MTIIETFIPNSIRITLFRDSSEISRIFVMRTGKAVKLLFDNTDTDFDLSIDESIEYRNAIDKAIAIASEFDYCVEKYKKPQVV